MKKIFYLMGGILLLSSCSSFLDRQPVAEIGSEVYFTSENSLLTYTNGFLNEYLPGQGDITYFKGYADIIAEATSTEFLYTPVWTPSLQDGWSTDDWNPIYNINYFLAHFREVPDLDEEVYNHYEGTARFWRAWKYWDFVKEFGAVPWYDEPIDASDEEALYKPRDNREYVMSKVLEDINFACENIYGKESTYAGDWVNCQRVSKYVALALKIRICLFEGTYRKYHSVDPSTGQAWLNTYGDSETFLRECVNACEELMAAGYSIRDAGDDASRQTQYKAMFNTTGDIVYDEIIWAHEFNAATGVFNQCTWVFTASSYLGRWGFDQDFVQTYLHRDGSRHADVIDALRSAGSDVTLTTEEFAGEVNCSDSTYVVNGTEVDVVGRDYRMKQEMITPGYIKTVNGVETVYSPMLMTAPTGYQSIKWNKDDNSYEGVANGDYSLPIFRYAECLLAYAEAKCELGEFSTAVWDETIAVLRRRAGFTEEGAARPTTIDQTVADYYGGLTDPDLVEIRRERAIEMLWEDGRYDDLMRWHLGELLNKQWYGIYIPEMNVPIDLDGNGTYDVAVVDADHADAEGMSQTNTVINLSTTGQYSLEHGTYGRLMLYVPRYFDEQRYLHPIPKTAMDINPALGQNYYWQ